MILKNKKNDTKKDILVWGLYIGKIDFETPFKYLIGNATSSWGMVDYFSVLGYSVGLVIDDNCELINIDKKNENIEIIMRKHAVYECNNFRKILFSTTTIIALFKSYPEIENIRHKNMFIRICIFHVYDGEKYIQFINKMNGICCNNLNMAKNIKQTNKNIPIVIMPYGVMHNNPAYNLIQKTHTCNNAIWIGAIRSQIQLINIVEFANANPECEVEIISELIFDFSKEHNLYGGLNNPYINQTGDTVLIEEFKNLVKLWCNRDIPSNINYLGGCRGIELDKIISQASVALSFSRQNNQTWDDSKILSYLSMGLPVICDDAQPSYRFINELKFGSVIPFSDVNKTTLRTAYLKCKILGNNVNRKRKISKITSKRYDWFALSKKIEKLMKCYNNRVYISECISYFVSIYNNKEYLKIVIFGISIVFKINENRINKIAWWIPIKKWRKKFRKKFE